MRRVKVIKYPKLFVNNRNRIFIENDFEASHRIEEEIEEDFGMIFSEAFPNFIGDASNKPEQVLKAIQQYDDIFVMTSYVGESQHLLNKMLEACLALNIKGKRLFNFMPRRYMHMQDTNRDILLKVEKHNAFYYRSDYAPNKSFELW